jgi:hypothetical protein
MTKDDIDQMWNQAMNEAVKNGENFTRYRFAALVAASEREACAKLCEAGVNADKYPTLTECATAIRARGQA